MDTIKLAADVEIQAAAGADKPSRVSIVAYNGGLMRVPGFGPVVINVAGLELGASTTLLSDHDGTLKGVVGAGAARVDGGKLLVAGTLAQSSEVAQKIIALAKEGVSFQASVGVEPLSRETIRGGAPFIANGQTIKNDSSFTYIPAGRLREVTITALGADPKTSVAIAARKSNMEGTISDDVLAERKRSVDFARILAKYPSLPSDRGAALMATALDENWSADRFELQAFRDERPQQQPYLRNSKGGGSAAPKQLIAAALMLHASRPDLAEKSFGEQVTAQAADLRCHSLVDICAAALHAEHLEVPADRHEMIRAAFSTISLPIALGTYAEKSAAEAFMESPATWRVVAKRKPVNNFFEHKIVRVLLVGNLKTLPPQGEIKHGTFTETSKTVQAATKALMLGIDRHDVINDNLGAFNDVALALALSAARTMNDDFATVVMGNVGSFFHATNSNLGTGAGSALSATSLAAGIAAMAKQTNAEGQSIDVRAATLMVPAELEFVADQLINSAEVMRVSTSDQVPTGNPLQRRVTRVTEPRLSNSAFTGYSATAWYLFAPPSNGAVNVALLQGRDAPTIERDDQPFNKLGQQYRAFIDYGFSLGEPVAAYKANGA